MKEPEECDHCHEPLGTEPKVPKNEMTGQPGRYRISWVHKRCETAWDKARLPR
jgi:hypothetical protein